MPLLMIWIEFHVKLSLVPWATEANRKEISGPVCVRQLRFGRNDEETENRASGCRNYNFLM